jgi:hypothetical protein
MRQQTAAEAEKKALIEHLSKPSGVSDEEGIRRAILIIQRAAAYGLTEVQVFRFPNTLCIDHGRAINKSGTGLGKHAYRRSEGNLHALATAFSRKGLQSALPDRRFSP